uniref:NR LBD domain-containing protein n=1 Tax=Caenorhabditis tropicalis TaxID=1561998 RepID=A0A1I7TDC8_9PELO
MSLKEPPSSGIFPFYNYVNPYSTSDNESMNCEIIEQLKGLEKFIYEDAYKLEKKRIPSQNTTSIQKSNTISLRMFELFLITTLTKRLSDSLQNHMSGTKDRMIQTNFQLHH